MIIYNITCSVDKEIAEEWITWMKDKHIPGLLNAGLFESYKILRVLSHEDDQTFSFAVQYSSQSMDGIQKYYLNDDIQTRFGERVLIYPTVLEEV
jgi:hypothetical protein